MNYKYLSSVILVCILWFASSIVAPLYSSDSTSIKLSLLTCSPGEEIYSHFGHSALRLKDNQGLDIVFNYGTFDFDAPGFIMKFVRGKLPYKLAVSRYDSFIREYQYFKRSIKEQVVNLDSTQTANIVAFLKNNAKPENALYAYDFLFDNCSTRIRDIFYNEIANTKTNAVASSITYRDQLIPYIKDRAWTSLGIHLILSGVTDQVSDFDHQMFLPDYLHDHLAKLENEKGLVLQPTKEILSFIPHKSKTTWYLHPNLLFAFILLILVLSIVLNLSKTYLVLSKMIFLVTGIVGLLYLFMWFATDHQSTYGNWNLLWLNPLMLLLLFRKWKYRVLLIRLLIALNLISLLNIFIGFLPQYFDPLFVLLMMFILTCLLKESTPSANLKDKKADKIDIFIADIT